jgi:hypothetical protein
MSICFEECYMDERKSAFASVRSGVVSINSHMARVQLCPSYSVILFPSV